MPNTRSRCQSSYPSIYNVFLFIRVYQLKCPSSHLECQFRIDCVYFLRRERELSGFVILGAYITTALDSRNLREWGTV